MSESEREMPGPWLVIVPRIMTGAMLDAAGKHVDIGQMMHAWSAAIKVRPPIPPDVFAAMVERGARAICERDGHAWPNEHEGEAPAPGQYFTRDYNDRFQRNAYRKQAAACLRAVGISDE